MVAATGFFDGVHKGHREVISMLCELAKERGEKVLLFLFGHIQEAFCSRRLIICVC
jgi:FAD synthase